MQLFTLDQAKHFCVPLANHVPGVGQSLPTFHSGITVTRLTEGTPYFNAHRVSLLNAVERWILFGVANYRRAIDMLIPSNAPWAHVTLYYSSFFAANAILGMFGGFVKSEGKRTVVDVVTQGTGAQTFLITRKAPVPLPATGSHGVFWAYFYNAAPHITAWAPA